MTALCARQVVVGFLICLSLLAVTPGGCPSIELPQINPNNRVPEANAGDNASGCVNEAMNLDASGSTDADGDSLTYSWSKVSGPAVSLSSLTSQRPSWQATAPGTYEFSVTVSDGRGGSNSDSVRVTIEDCSNGNGNDNASGPDAENPPPGWKAYNGHWYKLTSSATSWASAEAEAVAEGGHLVSVQSEAEHQWLVATFPAENVWIGLRQSSGSAEPAGGWQWSDGSSSSFSRWFPAQPDNSAGVENRAVLIQERGDCVGPESQCIGSWNDYNEDGPFRGIIERLP